MRDFANAMGSEWLQRRTAELGLALGLGPAFAWLSPFGLEDPPFFARVGFWTGVMACWFLVVALTEHWLARVVGAPIADPRVRHATIIGLAALPMVAITGSAIDLLKGWEASIPEVTELYLQIVVLGSLTLYLARGLMPDPGSRVAPAGLFAVEGLFAPESANPPPPGRPAVDVVAAPPLMTRLPPDIRAPLLCLEMQDHYVRVHTERGTALILMRLRDAIAETAPAQGRQVHRSWWIADHGVERCVRAGRACSVQLTNGLAVPVSQRYVRDVEAAYGENFRALSRLGRPA
ncbi:LytTR family DNA-binding domain-containing protein [Ancylobacter sp.]|uniref:LytTR family DNA-binding domain-containing protein n=1 Tax=Ancylobacter sp. TaxID=1872567 RepID=UPI003D0EAA98